MTPSSIHFSKNGLISSFLGWTKIFVYIYHIFCIHSSAKGHLGWFYVLVIVTSTAIIMDVWHVDLTLPFFTEWWGCVIWQF